MSKYQNSNLLDGLTLGKSTKYSNKYDAKLLQAVPRSLNRDDLHLKEGQLPFHGEDVWYGYELSWLNSKGKPEVAVAEFRVPCTSDNLIESKSFKLYLNSFNQTAFENWAIVKTLLKKDLSKTANAPVSVSLFKVDNCPALCFNQIETQCIDDLDIEITQYDYQANLLNSSLNDQNKVTEKLVSHLLKSNCLITNQPDWASVYIEYSGQQINHEALLRYLISFREHNEFHEQCVERIFCDIKKYCKVDDLTVYARYTRRGGLDINPFRSTKKIAAPNNRTLRQ